MSKKTTTDKEPEQASSKPSPAPKAAQSPAEGADHQGSQTDAGTHKKGKSDAPEKYNLRSDEVILKDGAGHPKVLDKETGEDLVRMLSTVRPLDNWRLEVIE